MTFVATRTELRPLRVRHRRQPRGGRAERDQDPLDDRAGVHRHGHPRRRSPRPCRPPGSTPPRAASGTLAELYVIAAAVIGGTSLAGGIGTIPGAMLGALVAQSLQSGMVLHRGRRTRPGHRRRRRAGVRGGARLPLPTEVDMTTAEAAPEPIAAPGGDARHPRGLRRRPRRRRRERRPVPRRGGRPGRRQRRRQDHADQDAVGRAQGRLRPDHRQRAAGARSTILGTPSCWASRRSTRPSRSPTTSTPRRTSSSAGRCAPGGGRWTTRPWRTPAAS